MNHLRPVPLPVSGASRVHPAPEALPQLRNEGPGREAINNSPLSDGDFPVHVDAGLIRLGGDVGRPITQAVSRALHEQHPEVDGIAYWSRIDSSERCWAIYGHVPVDVAIADLSSDNPQHRAAVQDVATVLKVPIPPAWR